MFKKYFFIVALVFTSSIFASNFPTCPDANTASNDLYNLQSVTDSTLPNGWHLYYGGAQSTPDYDSQYNYYAATPPVGKTPLQQIHYLSIMLHSVNSIDYSVGNTDYRQCVYYGSMDASGNPQGTQVVTLQYSHTNTPTLLPLTLNATQPLAANIKKGQTYTTTYTLNNPNSSMVNYTITPVSPLPTGVSFVSSGTSCDVTDHTATLNANTNCSIELNFDPRSYPLGTLDLNVLSVSAAAPVQPSQLTLHTNVEDFFAHNIIIFGDSLSDLCGHATNYNPDANQLMWEQYFVKTAGVNDTNMVCDHASSTRPNPIDINVDYAVGGATTANLPGQMTAYINDVNNQAINPNTKIFVWMGGNNIIGKAHPTIQDGINAANDVVRYINTYLEPHIAPDHIYIINMPNIGASAGHEGNAFTQAAIAFNSRLPAAIDATFPGLKPHVVDIFNPEKALLDYLTNPQHQPNPAYDQYGFNPNLLLQRCNAADPNPTNPCKGYLSWDGTHPTAMAHLFLANSFVAAVQ